MYCVSITKYNPIYRVDGKYTKDEWTSFSDVDNEIGGVKVSLQDYLEIERKYISAFFLIVKFFKCDNVKLLYLSKNDNLTNSLNTELLHTYSVIQEDEQVLNVESNKSFLTNILILVLREFFSNSLEIYLNEDIYIEFGYDYYMYLCVNNEQNIDPLLSKIENLGLFLTVANS